MKTSYPKLCALFLIITFSSCIRSSSQPTHQAGQEKQIKDTLQLPIDCFNENLEDSVFSYVKEMPEFPGGQEAFMKFLSNHLTVKDTSDASCYGRVIIQFIVSKNGKIVNPKVIRSACPEMDKQYINIIKSFPDWKPGKHNGKPVNVYFTMPIVICLKE